MALVLTRRVGQSLSIGDGIDVTVTRIRNGTVRLSIAAPHNVKILRREAVKDEEAVWKEWADRQRYGDND